MSEREAIGALSEREVKEQALANDKKFAVVKLCFSNLSISANMKLHVWEKCNWVALDLSGCLWGYITRPIKSNGVWIDAGVDMYTMIGIVQSEVPFTQYNWANSLTYIGDYNARSSKNHD